MMIDFEQKQAKPITDWVNEPTVEVLKRDLELAKQSHDEQNSKISKWNDLLTISGSSKPKKVKGRSSVQPKLVRRQAEWRYPALSEPFLNSDKIFTVSPRTFEDLDSAKQNELLLNYQFDTKLNKVNFIDNYVRTVVDEGTCIIQVGWDRQTIKVQEEVPVYSYFPIEDPQDLQILQEAQNLRQSNPREYEEKIDDQIKASIEYTEQVGEPVMAELSGSQIVETEKVIDNKPIVKILDNKNVYIDPTCNGDFNNALFVILSFETNQAECLKAGIYSNLDKVNWSANEPSNDGEHDSLTEENFKDDLMRRKVVAYEYWGFYDIHKDGNLVPIVATWIGNVMIRMEENPYPDGKLPFVLVQYLPVKRSIFGEPDSELLEENQQIMGAITRGLIDNLARSANAQQGFAKGMLDPLNKRRFENGEDYEFNPNLPPNLGYIEHSFNELPQTVIGYLQMLNSDAESLTGVKSFSGGLSGNAYGNVAAGVQGMIDAATKRETAILRRLAYGIAEVGNKIIAMNAVFLSDTEVIRVTNRQFIEIKREDIKGNFDLKVDINTVEMDQNKAQDLGFMLQTIGPNIDPAITFKILAEIAELKRMPSLAEELRNYRPQPDPIEEQKRQLEVQEEQAKVEFVQARSEKLMAETNKINIEATQLADGTAHQYDMEKQRAQANANQDLEVTKSILKNRKKDEVAGDIEAAIGYNVLSNRKQKADTAPKKLANENLGTVDPLRNLYG